jgi:type II secretory pathway predicted ATPase ExeA
MKSIVEQYNTRRHDNSAQSSDPLFPVLGRLSRSPIKRLARAYRDRVSVMMLVSLSRLAPGYVVDRFLASIVAQTTVIRVERSFDDPAAFLNNLLRAVGIEPRGTSLSQLNAAFELFLRCQKLKWRRTVLVLKDIDAHGRHVLAWIRDLVDKEVANDSGLMIVATGPADDSLRPPVPELEAISSRAAERIVLTPFVLSETRAFVRDRFERTDSNGGRMEDAGPRFEVFGIRLIHELASGVPETVDLLSRKSVEIAAGNDQVTVSTTEVKAAARLLGLMQDAPDEPPGASAPELGVSAEVSVQLIVRVQGVPEKTIPMNRGSLLIGRDRLCEISVDDAQVSRLHGLVARSTDAVYYFDLGSKRGSAINGQAAQRQVLANNDVIAVGDVRIIYSSQDASGAEHVDLDATDTFEILNPNAHAPGNPVRTSCRAWQKP